MYLIQRNLNNVPFYTPKISDADGKTNASTSGRELSSKIKETLLNKKNKIEKEMERINTRLNNKSFIERAPNDIVDQEKSNFINLEKDVNKLNYTLESL